MATMKPTPTIKLDWSKLLGFDQADASPAASRLAMAGLKPKVGSKTGAKIGQKAGIKVAPPTIR